MFPTIHLTPLLVIICFCQKHVLGTPQAKHEVYREPRLRDCRRLLHPREDARAALLGYVGPDLHCRFPRGALEQARSLYRSIAESASSQLIDHQASYVTWSGVGSNLPAVTKFVKMLQTSLTSHYSGYFPRVPEKFGNNIILHISSTS